MPSSCEQLSEGIEWPALAHSIKERLIASFSRPHVLEASFDSREEASALLHGMDPSLSDGQHTWHACRCIIFVEGGSNQ